MALVRSKKNFKTRRITMRNIYTVDKIKESATYRELESKKEIAKCSFLTQRLIREKISHAVAVWKNTGFIPQTVSGIYLAVVQDIINQEQTDRAFMMNCESITLCDEKTE